MGERCRWLLWDKPPPRLIATSKTATRPRRPLHVARSVPEPHEEAVKAQGRARFELFVQQLARHLQRGNSLVREVHEDLYPDASQFFGADGTRRAESSEAQA